MLWNRIASFHVIIIKMILRRGKHDYEYIESVDSVNGRIIMDQAIYYQIIQNYYIIVDIQSEYRKDDNGFPTY